LSDYLQVHNYFIAISTKSEINEGIAIMKNKMRRNNEWQKSKDEKLEEFEVFRSMGKLKHEKRTYKSHYVPVIDLPHHTDLFSNVLDNFVLLSLSVSNEWNLEGIVG
jgi:hypothetical protein